MNGLLIKLFNAALKSKTSDLTFEEGNKKAIKYGYIVHPDVCRREVINILRNQKISYNATFYRQWNDIISKDRFELFIDQIMHYATTYGTAFTTPAYVAADYEELDEPLLTALKVIVPITEKEVITRCEKMLFSGIALKQETIEDVLSILTDLGHQIDVEKVNNKEAKLLIMKQLDLLPQSNEEMVRYLIYLATTKTLLIKDKSTINDIRAVKMDVSNLINRYGVEKLSESFHRFKPIFLAFKEHEHNCSVINKMRKLAVKNHKPHKKTYIEQILNGEVDKTRAAEMIDKLTNFKKVALLQSINIRLANVETRAFNIRNQKLWMELSPYKKQNNHWLGEVATLLYMSLVDSMKLKACKIRIPEKCHLKLPTSEKSFIGNYPLGTAFDFSDSDNIVGIHWRSDEGADDFDLSLNDLNGYKIGWNSDYTNERQSLLYSGDMTSAYPEAVELIYASGDFTPGIIKVNRFRGENNSKFRFFIAREDVNMRGIERNYMVDPNNVLFTIDCVSDSTEKSLGVITSSQFILAHFRTGNGRVSGKSVTDKYTEYTLNTLDSYVDMRTLLKDAGFEFVDEEFDIDLQNLSKDTLIDLMS